MKTTYEHYGSYCIIREIIICEENLKHIFDIFYRADQARTRVYDGSGLGLAVCKEIVELHQGHIWATSKEGHGTTIMISLNREDA